MKTIEIVINLYFFFAYIIISKIALITVQKPMRYIMKRNKLTPKMGNDNFKNLSQLFVDDLNMYHASGMMCLLYFSINITIVNIISKYIPLYDLFEFNKIILFVIAIGIIPHYFFSLKNDNYIKYFEHFKNNYKSFRTKYLYILLATFIFFVICYGLLI